MKFVTFIISSMAAVSSFTLDCHSFLKSLRCCSASESSGFFLAVMAAVVTFFVNSSS